MLFFRLQNKIHFKLKRHITIQHAGSLGSKGEIKSTIRLSNDFYFYFIVFKLNKCAFLVKEKTFSFINKPKI